MFGFFYDYFNFTKLYTRIFHTPTSQLPEVNPNEKQTNTEGKLGNYGDIIEMKIGKKPSEMTLQESKLFLKKENLFEEVRKVDGSFENIKKVKSWNHIESLRNRIDEINTQYNSTFTNIDKVDYEKFLEWSKQLEQLIDVAILI